MEILSHSQTNSNEPLCFSINQYTKSIKKSFDSVRKALNLLIDSNLVFEEGRTSSKGYKLTSPIYEKYRFGKESTSPIYERTSLICVKTSPIYEKLNPPDIESAKESGTPNKRKELLLIYTSSNLIRIGISFDDFFTYCYESGADTILIERIVKGFDYLYSTNPGKFGPGILVNHLKKSEPFADAEKVINLNNKAIEAYSNTKPKELLTTIEPDQIDMAQFSNYSEIYQLAFTDLEKEYHPGSFNGRYVHTQPESKTTKMLVEKWMIEKYINQLEKETQYEGARSN